MSCNWPTVALGKYCSKIGSGATPRGGSSVYLDSGEITLIRSQNIYNDGFKAEGLVYITSEAAQKLKNVIIESNDILINITGDSVARVCLAPKEYLPARVNQHVAILRVKPDEFDHRYLRYFLTSTKMQNYLLTIASTGATRNALTKSMLESLEISKPPLDIQRNIGDVLEQFENKILLNTKTNQTLEEMAQAIFKSWFVDFDPVKAKMNGEQPEGMDAATASLFPEKLVESEKGLIPEGWKIGQVKELCKLVQNGGTPKRKESEYWNNGTINWFTTSELSDSPLIESKEKISELGLAKSSVKLWPKGTVLIAIYAAPTVGRLGILSQEAGSNQACTGLIPKTNDIGHYLFNSLYFARDWLNNISVGAAQQNISKGIVESLEIVIPSDELIESFGRHVETLWQKRLQLQKESQCLANLRDTLLPKLLSGTITSNAHQNEQRSILRDTLLPKLLSGEIKLEEENNLTGALA
ncbi:restriction endonuclease subunit S [Vibrio mediterranei]